MNLSLTEFRDFYREHLLLFLWRQWSALGAAGYGETKDNWVIDPEALLLFTCFIGRYEARLFDEVLDWLDTNGSFINVQRLKRIMQQEPFAGKSALSAIAAIMSQRHKFLKWKGLARQTKAPDILENLFFLRNSQPMENFGQQEPTFQKYGFSRGKIEFRGHTQPVRVVNNTGFLFKLRALFGISARCEILVYLLTHKSAHPSLIAKEIYYSQKTVQDTLVEMAQSGLIRIRPIGKEKHYWLKSQEWLNFLMHQGKPLLWVKWPPLLSAFEQIWIKLNKKEFLNLEPLVQSSELRALMRTIRPKIEGSGFAEALSDDKPYLGENYTPVFLSDIRRLLDTIKI